MNRDLLEGADGRRALLNAAKIERALQTEATHHFDIGAGKMTEMVGTENLPPTHRAAIVTGIAAEITEIAGANEIEMTGGNILHDG